MAEWSNAPDSKSGVQVYLYRGFESLSFRQFAINFDFFLCDGQATTPDPEGEAWSCKPSTSITFMMVANSGLPSAESAL